MVRKEIKFVKREANRVNKLSEIKASYEKNDTLSYIPVSASSMLNFVSKFRNYN